MLRWLTRIILQFIGLLTVIGLLAAAFAIPLLPRILQVKDKIEKADLILPLAGEWHRMIKAAELYKSGYAPKILLSNAQIRPPSRFDNVLVDMGVEIPGRRALRRQLLSHLGVPDEAVESFGDGHISTTEEAEAFRKFLRTGNAGRTGPSSVILITSPYHTRRAKMIFGDTMPKVRFMVTSPPEDRLEAHWWQDQRSAVFAVTESFKYAYYLLGGRFQSTKATP